MNTTFVNTDDRFGLTLVLAIIVHFILILGISFDLSKSYTSDRSLEVTLASFKDDNTPKRADYLAQLNQKGSGTLDSKSKPSSDLPAPFQDTIIQEVILQPSFPKKMVVQGSPDLPLITSLSVDDQTKIQISDEKLGKKKQTPQTKNLPELRNNIASLEAAFYEKRELYAKRPVIKRLNMATTKASPGANYMYNWKIKVTQMGNLNFPAITKNKNIYGELEMVVRIRKDGSLDKIEVIKSSGYTTLDKAAVDIVKLSAPFEPFPNELLDNDIIEIIRTWRFEKGHIKSS